MLFRSPVISVHAHSSGLILLPRSVPIVSSKYLQSEVCGWIPQGRAWQRGVIATCSLRPVLLRRFLGDSRRVCPRNKAGTEPGDRGGPGGGGGVMGRDYPLAPPPCARSSWSLQHTGVKACRAFDKLNSIGTWKEAFVFFPSCGSTKRLFTLKPDRKSTRLNSSH